MTKKEQKTPIEATVCVERFVRQIKEWEQVAIKAQSVAGSTESKDCSAAMAWAYKQCYELMENTIIEKPEFIKRYVERIKPLELTDEMAEDSAEASFEHWDRIDTPEDCADGEISAWEADA